MFLVVNNDTAEYTTLWSRDSSIEKLCGSLLGPGSWMLSGFFWAFMFS